MSWRGWSIGDRVTGLTEPLSLADLPIYRPNAPLRKQSRTIHLFREIDNRVGYYVGGRPEMAVLTALLLSDNRRHCTAERTAAAG